jgi:nucleoporin NUP159
MFGSNTFGALAMDTSAAPAATGTQLREGEEVDVDVSMVHVVHTANVQWLKLIRTNHEVYVRVSDKVDVASLPNECCLLAVANHHDLLVVGGNNGMRNSRLT